VDKVDEKEKRMVNYSDDNVMKFPQQEHRRRGEEMNTVRYISEGFKERVQNLNSKFGDVVQCNVGVFDAKLSHIPPFVDTMPPKDLNNCFTFDLIKTGACRTHTECEIVMKSYINDYISEFDNLEKCTLVWRIPPYIEYNECNECNEKATSFYRGYTRMKIINKDSKRGNYI